MKKAFFLAIAFSLVVLSSVCAEGIETPEAATEPAIVTLTGVIIDNMCATQNAATVETFIKTHTKECALQCASSGYAILANGTLTKFDAASNGKVEEFLKKADSTTKVIVIAKEVKGELSLVSITNQTISK